MVLNENSWFAVSLPSDTFTDQVYSVELFNPDKGTVYVPSGFRLLFPPPTSGYVVTL